MLEKINQFSTEEKQCAIELMNEYLQEGQKDYEFLVAVKGNSKICGFVCFGDISLTDACYDLYWIVTDPLEQKQGVGTKLLNDLEKILEKRGTRKLFAETSSLDSYTQARSFYIKKGFELIAQIPDFYKPGDDKLIYVKNI